MKKYLLILLCIITPTLLKGQNITVTNFYLDQYDLTANRTETMRRDRNNDEPCALIRIQTVHKGFEFDGGSYGVEYTDENHAGEIWLYVPNGARKISIRHPQLGSLNGYFYSVGALKGASTYYMYIESDAKIDQYDHSHKQILNVHIKFPNATFQLAGQDRTLDSEGRMKTELSFGPYSFRVDAENYYPLEGNIMINDSINEQSIIIDSLKPKMGMLDVATTPHYADVYINDEKIQRDGQPIKLQTGQYKMKVEAKGFKTQTLSFGIEMDKTTVREVELSPFADFKFSSLPSGASIRVNDKFIGITPLEVELISGNYKIQASKRDYVDFEEVMNLSSSEPKVDIKLKEIFNNPYEFYIELGGRWSNLISAGATMGCYIGNVNIEASYHLGLAESEIIYWNSETSRPTPTTYKPSMIVAGSIGYGFAIGRHFRITPQLGSSFTKLEEIIRENNLANDATAIANGAYCLSATAGVRFSLAMSRHIALSVTPTYNVGVKPSLGYETLTAISPTISSWNSGIGTEVGLLIFF